MAADAAAYARYNASPKGKARKARYAATESGRAVRRAADRRRYQARKAAAAQGTRTQPGHSAGDGSPSVGARQREMGG